MKSRGAMGLQLKVEGPECPQTSSCNYDLWPFLLVTKLIVQVLTKDSVTVSVDAVVYYR